MEDTSKSTKLELNNEIQKCEAGIKKELKKFGDLKKDRHCFTFLFGDIGITNELVDDTFDKLREEFGKPPEELFVVVDSGGGEIDPAYNLALLFRRYATKKLHFIVPRWAKSAATLLVLGGDDIYMGPIAELGPIDPQILQMNPIEGRLEKFSPLHIESTLELIRHEFEEGNKELANSLMQRLQFPLTLGSFKKSLDIGRQYTIKLLKTRMLKTEENNEKAETIAHRLTEGYANHGYCIDIEEAKTIGLNVKELSGNELDIIWRIHKLYRKMTELKRKRKEKEMTERIKSLPPELLDKIPKELKKKSCDLTKIEKR